MRTVHCNPQSPLVSTHKLGRLVSAGATIRNQWQGLGNSPDPFFGRIFSVAQGFGRGCCGWHATETPQIDDFLSQRHLVISVWSTDRRRWRSLKLNKLRAAPVTITGMTGHDLPESPVTLIRNTPLNPDPQPWPPLHNAGQRTPHERNLSCVHFKLKNDLI